MSAWKRLPTLRQLTARLRTINEAFAHPEGGPGSVCLWWEGYNAPSHLNYSRGASGEWVCGCNWGGFAYRVGPEEVPGNDTFDAVAAALACRRACGRVSLGPCPEE